MSNKLPKHFLDEMFRKNIEKMNVDPDQTIPDDLSDTLVDGDEDTETHSPSTFKMF